MLSGTSLSHPLLLLSFLSPGTPGLMCASEVFLPCSKGAAWGASPSYEQQQQWHQASSSSLPTCLPNCSLLTWEQEQAGGTTLLLLPLLEWGSSKCRTPSPPRTARERGKWQKQAGEGVDKRDGKMLLSIGRKRRVLGRVVG